LSRLSDDRHPGGTAFAVRKGIPHTHVDLPPLVSVAATGVYKPTGNKKVLLADVYKPPVQAWSDTDVIELLSFRSKSVLAGDLNAKNTVWNSRVTDLSGRRLLDLQDNSDFRISAQQSPTHYTPQGNGDVLHIVVHRNVRLSGVTAPDIWIQIISQYCSTSWIILALRIFWSLLKFTRTGSGFEA